MPSSHANSLAFFAAFLSLGLRAAVEERRCSSSTAVAAGLGLWLYTGAVCFTRVQITCHHTWPQVGVGVALGSASALAWWHIAYTS